MTYANEQRRRSRFEQVPLSAVPMLTRKRVLNICEERTLLQTRTAILEAAGFHAVAASTVESARQALALDSFDAVVICHSISHDDRQELIRAVRKLCPSARIVGLYNLPPQNDHGADRMIDAHDGPDSLIQALRQERN